MNVKDFDFELPQELIAQDPLEDRSGSKLLILDKDRRNRSPYRDPFVEKKRK